MTTLIAELEFEFLKVGPEKICAFVAEPVVCATAGCVSSLEGYFPGMRKLCDKYGILHILDEVKCGVCRTGTYFASERDNVVLDNGLGGGCAPISATLIHKGAIDMLGKI